jgi:hypothetical protein
MPDHICNRCLQHFNKKSNFLAHQKRKFPCTEAALVKKQLEQEVDIIKLKKKIKNSEMSKEKSDKINEQISIQDIKENVSIEIPETEQIEIPETEQIIDRIEESICQHINNLEEIIKDLRNVLNIKL